MQEKKCLKCGLIKPIGEFYIRRSHCSATEREIELAFHGRCDICGTPESELNRRLCMDHNHDTGEFRGLICQHCNKGLGNFRDSKIVLRNAISYLSDPCDVLLGY